MHRRKNNKRLNEAARTAGANGGGGVDDDNYQYIAYLKQFNKQAAMKHSCLFFKLNKFRILLLGAYVGNYDLMGGYEPCQSFNLSAAKATSSSPSPGFKRGVKENYEHKRIWRLLNFFSNISLYRRPVYKSSWRGKLKMGWISNVILASFFVFSALLLLDISYLYKHDIGRLRLKRIQDLIRVHGPQQALTFERGHPLRGQSMSLGEYEQVLEGQIKETRQTLSYLGDRFTSWGIINECIYLYVLTLCIILYLMPQWCYTWIQQLDVPFHRDILDRQDESRRADARCEDEVLKYLESNRMHAAIKAANTTRGLSRARAIQSAPLWLPYEHLFPSSSSSSSSPALQRIHLSRREFNQVTNLKSNKVEDHKKGHTHAAETHASDSQVCRLLTQMLTAGALRPINRSDVWIEWQNSIHIWITSLDSAYCYSFPICSFTTLYENIPRSFDLGEMCVLFISLLVGCSIIQHVTTFVTSCVTQVGLVNCNLSNIYDCISRNERQLRLYNAAKHETQQQRGEIVNRINSNYLFTLMTYKIFLKQWLPFKRTLRGVFITTLMVAFITPVIARVHLPYLAEDSGISKPRVRLSGFIFSFFILLPLDSFCLPMCFLHARCQRLYKALASLMAHIIEVCDEQHRQHEEDCGMRAPLYNEHAVSILFKEISQPKQMLEQFVVSNATFPMLVEAHFWFGLLALSILLDTKEGKQGESLSAFLADPLGVWNFHVTTS